MEQARKTYICDTSFFVDLAKMQFWTGNITTDINKNNHRVLLPDQVKTEYEHLVATRQDLGIPSNLATISGFFTTITPLFYSQPLRPEVKEKLSQAPHYTRSQHLKGGLSKPLSDIDKIIVQAALDETTAGEQVVVATKDEGIIAHIDQVSNELNINIEIESPWRLPRYNADIELLVRQNIVEQLARKKDVSRGIYVAMAKNIHVGSGTYYDIAFALYEPQHFSFPIIEGIKFIPVVDFDKLISLSGKPGNEYMYGAMTHRYLAEYVRQNGSSYLVFSETPNPISQILKRKVIQCLRGAGELDRREVKDLNKALDQKRRGRPWAMIDDHDLCRHSEGERAQLKIAEFSYKIDRFQHKEAVWQP